MDSGQNAIGTPLDRVDGRLKVTGRARYAADAPVPKVAYAALVTSTIAKGKVTDIDTSAAEKAPGVLAVLTHRNISRLKFRKELEGVPDPAVGRPLRPLQEDVIYHNGQPIAVIVADTLERATQAATLVKATYGEEKAITEFKSAQPIPPGEPKAGD